MKLQMLTASIPKYYTVEIEKLQISKFKLIALQQRKRERICISTKKFYIQMHKTKSLNRLSLLKRLKVIGHTDFGKLLEHAPPHLSRVPTLKSKRCVSNTLFRRTHAHICLDTLVGFRVFR